MFYVYVLVSKRKRGQIYVGYTTDLTERFRKHNQGIVSSTRPYKPWKLIFYEAYLSELDAKRREKYFKTTKGRKALRLILRDTLKLACQ
jgi:putative endonuclease